MYIYFCWPEPPTFYTYSPPLITVSCRIASIFVTVFQPHPSFCNFSTLGSYPTKFSFEMFVSKTFPPPRVQRISKESSITITTIRSCSLDDPRLHCCPEMFIWREVGAIEVFLEFLGRSRKHRVPESSEKMGGGKNAVWFILEPVDRNRVLFKQEEVQRLG